MFQPRNFKQKCKPLCFTDTCPKPQERDPPFYHQTGTKVGPFTLDLFQKSPVLVLVE